MKAFFARDARRPNVVTLHFSCEMPILVPTLRPHATSPPYPWLLSRATSLGRLAGRLSRINEGRFSVELTFPGRTFRDFVEELVVVPGFVQLLDGDRYSITFEVGHCFPTDGVCQAVVDCVARHFYPEETVIMEPAPKGERLEPGGQQQTIPTKTDPAV